MNIIDGNGHDDTSSNPGRSCLPFTYKSNYSPFSYGQIVEQTRFFDLVMATGLGERKLLIQTLKIDLVSHSLCAAW